MRPTRRDFLSSTAGLAATAMLTGPAAQGASEDRPINVLVWDERQPAQKEAYDNYLGNAIADHLRKAGGFSVVSTSLDDPGQGLTDPALDTARVLIWWGHVRQGDISPATGLRVLDRIKAGRLSLIALHSAHWATPFMMAMNERSVTDLEKSLPAGSPKPEIRLVPPPQRSTVPKRDARVTPYAEPRKFQDGSVKVDLHLPFCCFPAYRNDGKPSQLRVLKPEHPIVAGVPAVFEIEHEEMYDEPFHVPPPDEVILEERWGTGEWFRSGMLWKVGKGEVFYFRPGHETYPTYRQEWPLRVVTNATRWLARAQG